ncbi:MAG: hypothetical protein ABIN80_07700 [Dyadobacter sp.]|uniref:hypothetical protein n=1 Tax=Dyadobacter sp. TaxID=1914288 RepID=UPI0032668ED8
MNKLFLQACVVFCFLLSCQSEEIVSSKVQSNGKKSNTLSAAEISSLSNSNISDPTFLEPDNPESDGGAGGDLNFILPSTPTIDDGAPIILAGKAGAAFTLSGSSSGQSILFATAEPSAPRPLIIVPSARGLAMAVSFIYAGKRYIVRFYHSVTTNNGTIHLWTDPQPVQVVLGTLNSVPGYQYAVWSQSGYLVKPGQWSLMSEPVGEVSGQLFISQLTFNPQGQITLKAVLTMPGKTININYVNWNRWG